jgi:hypothetical protein
MRPTAASAAAIAAAVDNTKIESIEDDRLEGSEAIGRFINPNMPLRTVRRLLEDGYYPCWREGRQYVASKAALIAHWREMTGGFSPQRPTKTKRQIEGEAT